MLRRFEWKHITGIYWVPAKTVASVLLLCIFLIPVHDGTMFAAMLPQSIHLCVTWQKWPKTFRCLRQKIQGMLVVVAVVVIIIISGCPSLLPSIAT